MSGSDGDIRIVEKLIESITTANANTLAASQSTWSKLLEEQTKIRELLSKSLEIQREQEKQLEFVYSIPKETMEKVSVLQGQILEVQKDTRATMQSIRDGFNNGWTEKIANRVASKVEEAVEAVQKEGEATREAVEAHAEKTLLKSAFIFGGYTALLGFIVWLFEKIYHAKDVIKAAAGS